MMLRYLPVFLAVLLMACERPPASLVLTGTVAQQQTWRSAEVTVVDSKGNRRIAETDHEGVYRFVTSGLTPPLLVSAIAAGENHNCTRHDSIRAQCMASLVLTLEGGKANVANVNPLTDRIVSDVAVAQGFPGPQQWVNEAIARVEDEQTVVTALQHLRDGFGSALRDAGVEGAESFDPVSWPLEQHVRIAPVLALINHNRNYHNDTGETGHTVLTDSDFRPIVGLFAEGAYEPLDYASASAAKEAIANADIRVFIVGDSTAANYEQLRQPRAGWGQVFQQTFRDDASVKVVNGGRAGRSSRDYYHGGWFGQLASLIRKGDVVIIHHGHNDQNCNAARPVRGAADVANLCTYPNDEQGRPQFPQDRPELSFQHSLERYIRIARERGAQPVLMTPTTRVLTLDREQGTPVAHNHLTRQNAEQGYAFVGDYPATIRQLAAQEQVPLIDIEQQTIDFINALPADEWKQYLLVVDPAVNDYYANNMSGSTTNPDTTHFQQAGAEVVAKMVADGIRQQASLQKLAQGFRQGR